MGKEDVVAKNVGDSFISGQGVSLFIVFLVVWPNSPLFRLICEHTLSVHCSAHLQTPRI